MVTPDEDNGLTNKGEAQLDHLFNSRDVAGNMIIISIAIPTMNHWSSSKESE